MDPPERPSFSVEGLPPAYPTLPGVPAPAAAAPAGLETAWGYRMAGGLIDLAVPLLVASVIDAAGHSTDDAEAYAGLSLFAT